MAVWGNNSGKARFSGLRSQRRRRELGGTAEKRASANRGRRKTPIVDTLTMEWPTIVTSCRSVYEESRFSRWFEPMNMRGPATPRQSGITRPFRLNPRYLAGRAFVRLGASCPRGVFPSTPALVWLGVSSLGSQAPRERVTRDVRRPPGDFALGSAGRLRRFALARPNRDEPRASCEGARAAPRSPPPIPGDPTTARSALTTC